MNNMSDTKRTTQSWRRAALNHTSPFSAFIPLALALLRSPNSHKPMGAGSSPTGKLQSCARCVIFHSWKPGSGSQKPWADREIPEQFQVVLEHLHCLCIWWSRLGKIPIRKQDSPTEVLSTQMEGQSPQYSSELLAHPIWKIYGGFPVHKGSSSPALILGWARGHQYLAAPPILAPQQP